MKRSMLIVENDQAVAGMIRACARGMFDFFTIIPADTRLLSSALQHNTAMVVLDMDSATLDGLAVCHGLRSVRPSLGIVLLSSRAGPSDRVIGYQSGADDYIVKPFAGIELRARVIALCRRIDLSPAICVESSQYPLRFRDLQIDIERRRVYLRAREIVLSELEFDLLALFASRPGVRLSVDELRRELWPKCPESFHRPIPSLIAGLRDKIESNLRRPRFIFAVNGGGYRFCERTL